VRRWLPAVRAVASRPRLWLPGARAYIAHVPNGWYLRRPFLPVPDRAWMRFRLQTAYGDPDRAPDADDVVTWLEWLKGWRSLAR
jgi:hypothetical protein